MTTHFAAPLLMLAALALPVAALAQTAPAPLPSGAAATLPNTFDAPARPAPSAAPAPVVAATLPSDPVKVAAVEAILRTTIAAMQSGTPNYGDMTDDLAGKVREQAAAITPIFQQVGPLQTIAHVGTQDGAELFLVVFANAPTQWIIAQNPEGKITALLFRPAPPPAA